MKINTILFWEALISAKCVPLQEMSPQSFILLACQLKKYRQKRSNVFGFRTKFNPWA
jgi:hypothetical protein